MANFNFNGTTKIITPADAPVGGAIDIDVQDLYSRWVDWLFVSDNSKYQQAMRSVGGDPLPGSKQLGLTYFLLNGWKIRPYEADHIFTLNGNLYSEDGTSPFTPTIGSYNVTIISSVSNLVDSTVQQLPEIEFASFQNQVTIDVANGSAGVEYPLGTPSTPVNNLADAQTIAGTRGLNRLYIVGNITIGATDNINGYHLIGQGATFNYAQTTITLTSGCTTSNTTFEHAKVQGVQNGEATFRDCVIGEVTNSHCLYDKCKMVGPLGKTNVGGWLANHTSNYVDCYSANDYFVLDVNGSPLQQSFANFCGKLKVINCTHANAKLNIRIHAGTVWIDSTCTSGAIAISGVANLINDSAVTIDTSSLVNKGDIANTLVPFVV